MANIKGQIRSTNNVKVVTARVGANTLSTLALSDIGNVESLPSPAEEGSLLAYDPSLQQYVTTNVVDSGIF